MTIYKMSWRWLILFRTITLCMGLSGASKVSMASPFCGTTWWKQTR